MKPELTTAQRAIIERVGLADAKDAMIIELSFKLDTRERIIEQMQANVDLLTKHSNAFKNELLRINFSLFYFETYPDYRYEPNKWSFPMANKELLVVIGISLEEQVAWIREYAQSHKEDQDE